MNTAPIGSALAELRLAERAIATSLKARGYRDGECVDGWTQEVRDMVAARERARRAIKRLTDAAHTPATPPLRPYLCREWLIEDGRAVVLSALDGWAKASDLPNLPAGQEGATDADLPALFRGIDAHVAVVIERSGAIMPDAPYPQAFLDRTAAELAAAMALPPHR